MLYEETRREVAKTAREMLARGLVHGTSGNVSALVRPGILLVTPSGIEYAGMGPEEIVVIDGDGNVLDGRRRPTSEVPMHLAIYGARSDVGAVVHTHSDMATTLAVLGEDLPAVHYVLGYAGPRIRCAPYATFGTAQLATAMLEALGSHNAALLGNHGVVAVGATLRDALHVAECVEAVAGLYVRARSIGTPRVIDEPEMERVMRALAGPDRPAERG